MTNEVNRRFARASEQTQPSLVEHLGRVLEPVLRHGLTVDDVARYMGRNAIPPVQNVQSSVQNAQSSRPSRAPGSGRS